jgi:protoheme IX farnesyltransferase
MSDAAVLPQPRLSSLSRDYLQLSKSRIVMLVLITTAAGFLAGASHIDYLTLFHTMVGTALVAAGTNALNQYVEREHDKKMKRTRLRPLPAGRITPRAALIFSASIALAGTVYLALAVNWITAILGAITLSSYIFIYTPLKRISTICTLVGAVPGAIPPLMGWTAATGHLGTGGWILFGILFLWQLPHFMAISWIYREDYARGGFAMLAVVDEGGAATGRQAVFYSLLLLGVSVLPSFLGLTGLGYLVVASLAGALFIATALAFARDRNNATAKRLFMTSNIYLMFVMTLLVTAVRSGF